MVIARILQHEALDGVELAFLHGDPFRLILVACTFLWRHEIVSPARSPVSNRNLLTSRLSWRRLVEFIRAVEEKLTCVIARHVELVVASGWRLEPTLGDSAGSCVVVVGVLEGGEQLGLHDWHGAVSAHVPVWIRGIVV